MRITIVASSTYPARAGHYGAESQRALAAQALSEAGHEVTLIAAPGSRAPCQVRFVPPVSLFGGSVVAAETEGYRIHRELLCQSELVIDASAANIASENLFFWDRKRSRGLVSFVLNGSKYHGPRPPACFHLPGMVLSNAHRESVLESFPGLCRMDIPGLDIVPDGVDLNTYRPSEDISHEYFLYLSRPTPEKGIFKFLELAASHPNSKFVMAFSMSSPEHRKYGEAAIHQAQKLPNVRYAPLADAVQDKVQLFAGARALILPQQEGYIEAFGVVLAEAMACGTPCIAASHGSPREVLGKSGIICTTDDEYSRALEDVQRLDRGEVRRDAESRFSLQRWARDIEAFYGRHIH